MAVVWPWCGRGVAVVWPCGVVGVDDHENRGSVQPISFKTTTTKIKNKM